MPESTIPKSGVNTISPQMGRLSQSRLAYIAFDGVPAPKGASIHIESFVQALARVAGHVDLVTVSPTLTALQSSPLTLNWTGVTHTVLPANGKTLIDRVLQFREHLHHWLEGRWFDVIQVRSIFEGYPIALAKDRYCRSLIFEVNGLPSIELKYRYPKVADDPELMHKLIAQEQICLDAADWIITPSEVTRNYLIGRGGKAERIQVIPNGVNLSIFTNQPPQSDKELDPLTMLYSGTLSAWQGVDLALEALALYRRDFAATLTVVGPARGNQVAVLKKQARRLGVAEHITVMEPVSQTILVKLMHQADVIVAPLKPNDRNCVQGCCPLKVLEGMASGTPVITSDLPVVTDLGEPEQHFLAVRPGSAKAIKDALLRLRADPALRFRLSQGGRSHIEAHYRWQRAQQSLIQRYGQLIQPTPIRRVDSSPTLTEPALGPNYGTGERTHGSGLESIVEPRVPGPDIPAPPDPSDAVELGVAQIPSPHGQ